MNKTEEVKLFFPPPPPIKSCFVSKQAQFSCWMPTFSVPVATTAFRVASILLDHRHDDDLSRYLSCLRGSYLSFKYRV